MDLGALAGILRGQAAAKSALVLDASVFPASVLDDLRTALLLPAGAHLTITGVREADIPEPANGVLTIAAGTAAVLKQTGVGIALSFTTPGGAVNAVITATMSSAWTFTDSFAALDVFPFSSLKVSESRFVYATAKQTAFAWPGATATTIPLEAGLNFLSHVSLAKFARVTELVGKFIGVAPLKFHGPFGPKTGEQLPVGTLTARLSSGTFEIGSAPNSLSLGEPSVAVSVGTSDQVNPVQPVDLVVQGVFNRALTVAIDIPAFDEGLTVTTTPLPSGESIRGLVESLPGGSGFMSYVPAPLADRFARVGLEGFTMGIGPGAKVRYLHLAIATLESWELIPDLLTLRQLKLHVEILDPTGLSLKRVAVQSQATFFERVFPGVFEFTIELQKEAAWKIGAITGAYFGRANLGAVVGEVLRNQDLVPEALRAISFSDFGVTVTRHGAGEPATYTIFGGVETVFPLLGRQLTAHLNLVVTKTQAQTNALLTGGLVIGEQVFALELNLGAAGSRLHASWKNNGAPFGFATIAEAFGWDNMPALPENLDLGLTSAEFFYDFKEGTLALSAHSANYGDVLFATLVEPPSSPRVGQRTFVFALDVPLNVDLTALPVIGERLPSSVRLGVKNLEVVVASAELKAPEVTALRTILTDMLHREGIIPKALGAGVTFGAQLEMGGSTQAVVVPLTGKPEPAPKAALHAGAATDTIEISATSEHALAVHTPAAPAAGSGYQAGAKWFDVQKSFGPVHFERIGLQYQDGALFFLLDASLTFSALAFSLEGLGVGSPLKRFSPQAHLDGLAISFHSGPVAIEGGLRVVPKGQLAPNVDYQYIGAVTIAVDPYLIAGVASYAKVSGAPSFFMFAQVKGAFGGPPCFFITGFMGGFGYNSLLTLPPPDKVHQFPFVAGLDNPAVFGGNPTPMSALQVLAGTREKPGVLTPVSGETWLAAGVMFRSFELVFGRALVVAQFGREFQVSLLGVAKASLPQGATTNAYAYIELQLQAVFKPNEGMFSVIASLTPASFVITKDCRLSGGFAFCLWFGSNPHAGDFVVTVGGYHPAFAVPAWYPRVAPVGFNWRPNGNVTIKGGAYFALTPSAIMAGGGLEVLFHSGAIRAWFNAYANLLITWKPFHFNAGIGISLGAAVEVDMLFTTVTLSFEVGATLELWGPPTGGVVHVHLYIVSFSVSFGPQEGQNAPQPLGWDDFKTLLPQDEKPDAAPRAMLGALEANDTSLANNTTPKPAVLRVHVNRGLSRQDTAGRWFVRADELIFTTETAVPATALTFGTDGKAKAPPLATDAKPVTAPTTINIRPMGLSGVTSAHNISLTSIDRPSDPIDLATWTQVPQARNLPEAMWGAKLTPKPGGEATPSASSSTVPNLPVGTRLIAPPAKLGATPGAMNIDTLIDRLGAGWQPLTPATQVDPIPVPVVDPACIGKIASTLASPAAQTAQKNLLAALANFKAAPPTSSLLPRLAQQAGATYTEPPLRAV